MTAHPIFNHASPAQLVELMEQLNDKLQLKPIEATYTGSFKFPVCDDKNAYEAYCNEVGASKHRLMVCQMYLLKSAFTEEAYSEKCCYRSSALSLVYEANTQETLMEMLAECAAATGNNYKAINYVNLRRAFADLYDTECIKYGSKGASLMHSFVDLLLTSPYQRELFQVCSGARRLIISLGLDHKKPHLDHLVELFGLDKSADLELCLSHFYYNGLNIGSKAVF